jgi:asparagine synthetase B (glutamine-hydrolysing)
MATDANLCHEGVDRTGMIPSSFYRMTPFEVATGWLTGEDTDISAPAETITTRPVDALEAVLIPALARPPCVVAFSGGRDSSALLAVANRLAAREGFAAPIAATLRYPGDHDAHEQKWQELAVRYIGVRDWEVIAGGAAADLLGPVATAGLRRHGLLWPPAYHTSVPLLRLARGGSLITGDGGDEVFGDHRITSLTRVVGRWPTTRSEMVETVLAPAPRVVREATYNRSLRSQMRKSWLTPPAQRVFSRAIAIDRAAAPLSWAASVRRLPRMRAWRLGFHNQDLVAAAENVNIQRPLQHPLFLASLIKNTAPWGFRDRDVAMRALFASWLPDELLRRQSKARFNRVVFGGHCREFVGHWTGAGVPADLVDTEVLKQFWEAEVPHALSFALLQAAWLADTTPGSRGAWDAVPTDGGCPAADGARVLPHA